MNTVGSRAFFNTLSAARANLPRKSFFSAVALALLVSLSPARAEEPEDQYLRIYTTIEQADTLNNKGDAAQALTKYREAYTSLKNFQRSHPEWNAKTVSFRLNYLVDKITNLTSS